MADEWSIHYRETSDPDPHRVVQSIPDPTRARALERAHEMITKPHLKCSVLQIVGPDVIVSLDEIMEFCRWVESRKKSA